MRTKIQGGKTTGSDSGFNENLFDRVHGLPMYTIILSLLDGNIYGAVSPWIFFLY